MKHRRHGFSKDTKRKAYERSKREGDVAICECDLIPHVFSAPCGCALIDGAIFYEHIDPDRISARNDLDNCAALTKTCWRVKTSRYDLPVIARVRQREDRARGIRPAPTLPAGRRDPMKIKLANRQVVDRITGEPWRPVRHTPTTSRTDVTENHR
jgi:hypothetical protein